MTLYKINGLLKYLLGRYFIMIFIYKYKYTKQFSRKPKYNYLPISTYNIVVSSYSLKIELKKNSHKDELHFLNLLFYKMLVVRALIK